LVINACSDTGCGGLEVEGAAVGWGEGVDGGGGEDVGVLLAGAGVGVGAEVFDVQATAADMPSATSTAHNTPRRPFMWQY
jgi:hypothetical protein